MKKYLLKGLFLLAISSFIRTVVCQVYTPLNLDQIYKRYEFLPYSVSALNSMADGEHYSVLEGENRIVVYDYQTGKESDLVFHADRFPELRNKGIDDYTFSRDESKILLITGQTMIYRHSYKARHYIYELQSGRLSALSDHEHERLATFSPDGSKVAYVYENNLFIYDLDRDMTTQITFDGEKNRIINGAPDWVYEEEFGLIRGFCWSPDSRRLAYMRFDETDVKEFSFQIFGSLYPEDYRYKYPKAGEKNSEVAVKVYDTESKCTLTMDTGPEQDQYIPGIKWTASADFLAVIRLNRLQNAVDVLIASSLNGECRILYSEVNDRFISEINDEYIYFTGDNGYFLIRSERTGYFHYYLYSMDGRLINPVTRGNWEVDQLAGVDEQKGLMYYTSTEESVLQRQLYSVKLDGSDKKKLSRKPGHVEAAFSKTFRYYINTWSDAVTPPVISVHRSDGGQVRLLIDNNELSADIKKYGFSKKEFIRIPVSGDLLLNAYMIRPAGFDTAKRYPLLIRVYGGPGSQEVLDQWDNDLPWLQLLAQHGIVVACIDNRGTGGRGEAFRKSTYMQLGRLESEDQIAAAEYLSGFRWIDESRIGIYGWSYGGTVSLLCLARGEGVFKMAIAVAPVTSWRFYDTAYTERFMRRPKDNPSGYDDHAPLNYAAGMNGRLLLVHGTADDNVHWQNSVEMADRLIAADKQFEMFLYTNSNHNIYGGNIRFHLFTKLTDFVYDNL
ncbi:MAG: S9 family peptidase [Bacteroidales bacterium]|nr:S9 family peptidase [Bacteroidales bacterium]